MLVGASLVAVTPPFAPHDFARAVVKWSKSYRSLYPQFTADFLAQQASGPLTFILLGGLTGPAAVGALRGAQLLFNPLTIAINGSRAAVIPELVRARRAGRAAWSLHVKQLAIAVTLSCAVWCVIAIALPDRLGRMALGATWPSAHRLLLPMAVVTIAVGLMSVGFAAIRSLADATGSLRARLISAATTTGSAIAGASAGGALGAAIGMALAAPVGVAVWAAQLRTSARQISNPPASEVEPGFAQL
jgi:O-antigen/teichoic acid export membrane protein